MEGKKSKSRALLVFGAPCSGKTYFGERFAKRFGLAYYDFDKIKSEQRMNRKTILLIIELIARTGKDFMIEGELDTEKDRSEVRNLLRKMGYDPALIWVQTDVTTIRTRMKERYKSVSKAKTMYDAFIEKLEAPAEFEKPIILSGKHTFETQAKHVVSGLAANANADK